MKLNYGQAVQIYSATVNVPGGERPILIAIAESGSIGMAAQVRARRIFSKLEDEMKIFYQQRDAILTGNGVRFEMVNDVVVIVDDVDGEGSVNFDEGFDARRLKTEQALASLLLEETEDIPPLLLSTMVSAQGSGADLINQPQVVALLFPLIVDDM